MPVYQAYNKRINAWVIYKFTKKKGFKPLNVKQKNPDKPFKGVKIRGQRRNK